MEQRVDCKCCVDVVVEIDIVVVVDVDTGVDVVEVVWDRKKVNFWEIVVCFGLVRFFFVATRLHYVAVVLLRVVGVFVVAVTLRYYVVVAVTLRYHVAVLLFATPVDPGLQVRVRHWRPPFPPQ